MQGKFHQHYSTKQVDNPQATFATSLVTPPLFLHLLNMSKNNIYNKSETILFVVYISFTHTHTQYYICVYKYIYKYIYI